MLLPCSASLPCCRHAGRRLNSRAMGREEKTSCQRQTLAGRTAVRPHSRLTACSLLISMLTYVPCNSAPSQAGGEPSDMRAASNSTCSPWPSVLAGPMLDRGGEGMLDRQPTCAGPWTVFVHMRSELCEVASCWSAPVWSVYSVWLPQLPPTCHLPSAICHLPVPPTTYHLSPLTCKSRPHYSSSLLPVPPPSCGPEFSTHTSPPPRASPVRGNLASNDRRGDWAPPLPVPREP